MNFSFTYLDRTLRLCSGVTLCGFPTGSEITTRLMGFGGGGSSEQHLPSSAHVYRLKKICCCNRPLAIENGSSPSEAGLVKSSGIRKGCHYIDIGHGKSSDNRIGHHNQNWSQEFLLKS